MAAAANANHSPAPHVPASGGPPGGGRGPGRPPPPAPGARATAPAERSWSWKPVSWSAIQRMSQTATWLSRRSARRRARRVVADEVRPERRPARDARDEIPQLGAVEVTVGAGGCRCAGEAWGAAYIKSTGLVEIACSATTPGVTEPCVRHDRRHGRFLDRLARLRPVHREPRLGAVRRIRRLGALGRLDRLRGVRPVDRLDWLARVASVRGLGDVDPVSR